MDRAAIIAKARALTAWGGLERAAAERLIETVLNLGQGAKGEPRPREVKP